MVSATPASNHDQRARKPLEREHGAAQRLRVGEGPAADREQDVAAVQPDLRRAAARAYAAHCEAAARVGLEREAEQLRDERRDVVLRDRLGAHRYLLSLAVAHRGERE